MTRLARSAHWCLLLNESMSVEEYFFHTYYVPFQKILNAPMDLPAVQEPLLPSVTASQFEMGKKSHLSNGSSRRFKVAEKLDTSFRFLLLHQVQRNVNYTQLRTRFLLFQTVALLKLFLVRELLNFYKSTRECLIHSMFSISTSL